MQVRLTNPCNVATSELQPNETGYYCNSCAKQVTDYTGMSDAQLLKYVQNNGIGCGQFRNDQLNRELTVRKRRRLHLFYLPLMIALVIKYPEAKSQVKYNITQSASPYHCIDIAQLQEKDIIRERSSNDGGKVRFGAAGGIAHVERRCRVPFTRLFVSIERRRKWHHPLIPVIKFGFLK